MLTLNITYNNIQFAEKNSSNKCPIGLAFSELFPNANIIVFSSKVTVDNKSYYPADPTITKKFIQDFDSGRPVYPTVIEYYVK